MTALLWAALLALALVLVGYATVIAADTIDHDLEALLLSEEILHQLNSESDRWQR